MPAIKAGRGYAEDAAGIQRVIHRLSKDDDAPRDFVEECIADLSKVVERMNRHTRERAKKSTSASKKLASSKSTSTARA